MEWLTRLPVIGPLVVRLMKTHVWHAYERLDTTHWTRLAAAVTFTSFLALFPMIALGAAIAAAFLSQEQIDTAQDWLSDQVPGISDQIGIQSFVDNAATVGVIAGAALLFTGLGWVESLRQCLREVWLLPDEEVNPVLAKAKDLAMLAGLGGVVVVSLAGSAFTVGAVDWAAGALGVERDGPAGWLLRIVPVLAAVGVDLLLLVYLLTRVPGVRPGRRALLTAGLIGAVGFELLKLLIGGYLTGVAGKSMYGAFGVPVALLVWINLMAKLLLFCAAWTATEDGAADADPEARVGPTDPKEADGGGDRTADRPAPAGGAA
ncbi:YihY/virulence factor BrkB family protein [Streptomyces chumphonensis]|uniref:YihY/virulence factor BrkB family protein n=1 Tax=Streptomyces chumphonensis TaxID=1214925 RepID=A0A927F0Z4_9ACTN|nr:YihY/virulence factor BrkB family protein [Streptomyces chumphonensis]MBD3932347.1 YihY/virulence factor BrkB family protein [Streptomyces chumphonensis]